MYSFLDYMKEGGGIPQRYKNMGFTHVGQKKKGDGQHKWKVLAKKGNQYKIVQGGYRGMQDFSQHHSKKRQSNFWNRMGGRNSSKAKDPFSPLYWHKRLGKWEDGGQAYDMDQMQTGGMMFREVAGGDISIPNLTKLQVGGYFPRFMQDGGLPKYQVDGWVRRAANADLNFWEKCGLASRADNGYGGGGGRSRRSDQTPSYFESSCDLSLDNNPWWNKDDIKMIKKSVPEGLDKNTWYAMNNEARFLNRLYNPGRSGNVYGQYGDPATGRPLEQYLTDEYRSKTGIPEIYRYYMKTPLRDKKTVTAQDIYEYHKSLPGGLESYPELLNSVYLPKKQVGGENKESEEFLNSFDQGNSWLTDWYKQRALNPQFTDVANKRLDVLSRPAKFIYQKDNENTLGSYIPRIDSFARNTNAIDSDVNPWLWTHENTHRASLKAPQKFKRSMLNDIMHTTVNPSEAKENNFDRETYFYLRNLAEKEANLNDFRRAANLDPNKQYTNEEMLQLMKPYMDWKKPEKDKKDYTPEEIQKGIINRFLKGIRNSPESLNFLNNSIVGKINKNNYMVKNGGPLPKFQQRPGLYTTADSVKHQADKILQYEQLRGGPGGAPLPQYGNPEYMQMLMQGIYPEVQKILPNASAMEAAEAMDFIFNTGWDKNNKRITKDPRAYALQEYYRQYDPSKLDKEGKWSGRKNPPYSFDDEYNSTIGKLPENQRRILMNKGRDWYYKNINNPSPGVPNPDYKNTWFGRIWNTNDFNDFDPNNPKFTPNKKEGGEMIRRADGSYSQRGLWDNIRANKGSGKKPTKQMLEQENKIKSKEMKNGGINNKGFKSLPGYVQEKIISRMDDGGYTGTFSGNAYSQDGGMQPAPQQGGGQEQQIMQLIQAYAQIAQVDPREIMQQLQQMKPEEQQQALQQMVQTVQQASSGGGQEQPQMRDGGLPCYNCGGSYQYGGQMGGSYMPSMPAVSIYDLPIYQETGEVVTPRWHPEWEDQYSDSALAGSGYDEDAAIAQANAEALAQYPGPRMQQFRQPASSYQGNSIVDYLANAGVNASYASRKELAKQLGIPNYRGTAAQNLEMLDILRGGKTTIPTGRVSAKSAAKKLENKSSSKTTPKSSSQEASKSSIQEDEKPFWEKSNAKQIYLDAHPGMTSEQYDVVFKKGKQAELRQNNKPASAKAVSGKYDDRYFMKNIAPLNTDYSNQATFDEGLLNFFGDVVPSAILAAAGPGLVNSAMKGLMGARKVYPYGARMIPGGASKYLPGPGPRQLPAPRIVSSPRPGAPSGGYMQIGEDFAPLLGPRGFVTGSGMRSPGFPMYAEGGYMDPAWMAYGGIHINPANRGKFTASADRAGMGVQEFASHVLANREDYSPTQVKRANFARNASKWKHQEGGSIGVGSYVDDTPEMRAWLDANGYTYE